MGASSLGNQMGILSTGCFYLSFNWEHLKNTHPNRFAYLGINFSFHQPVSPFLFRIFATRWKPKVLLASKCLLETEVGFFAFFPQCQVSPSASFHYCTCFPMLLTIVLYLLEAEGFVTCRQKEAPSRCLPAAGPSSPPGPAHKGPLSSGFVCSCTKSESWALWGKTDTNSTFELQAGCFKGAAPVAWFKTLL